MRFHSVNLKHKVELPLVTPFTGLLALLVFNSCLGRGNTNVEFRSMFACSSDTVSTTTVLPEFSASLEEP